MVSKIKNVVAMAALLIATICVFSSHAYGAGLTSTTTLAVSSSSVSASTPVTLTATVTKTFSIGPVTSPVTNGTVIFCDATAAHCDGAAVFGTVQLTASGTAAIKLTLGVGTYSIAANFLGTTTAPSSMSAAQAVTVTANANYLSEVFIAATGSQGNYTLTGTVEALGKPTETGTVSFLDTSSGNFVVASAALDPATLTSGFFMAPQLTQLPAIQYVAAGDFNNDGIPDLAVATSGGNNGVKIYLGTGTGAFSAPVNYSVGSTPIFIAVGDVNGDGNLDLIVANINSHNVSVLLGKGDGTFNMPVNYAVGNLPSSIAVGDFNEDGNLDLAVINAADHTVGVLLGNGSGTFPAQVTYNVHPNPKGIVAGHFSNSSHLDLAVTDTNGVTQNVGILMGNGDGTFQSELNNALPSATFGAGITAGDLRNNGTVDLVVANASFNNVYVLLGNNDGTFQTPVAYSVALQPENASLGDVNGDGILDLVVADTGADGLVSVLLGNGDGTFATKTDYMVGNGPVNVTLADFNGDGLLDLATSDAQAGTSTILLGERTETATVTGVFVDGAGTHNVAASYPGNSAFAPQESQTTPLMGNPVTATSTTLMASPNPAMSGQVVTLTATVSPIPTGSPLGSVNFYSGSTLLGIVTVNSSGMAILTTSAIPLGFDAISAVYGGNAMFGNSTSGTIFENVQPNLQSTTVLTLSSSSVAAGASVTLTATVTGRGPVTSGTVLFCNAKVELCEDAAVLGTVQLSASGMAATKLTLGVGNYSFKAVFTGTDTALASTSAPQSLTVTSNGTYATATYISETGTIGNYSLSGSVYAFGATPLGGNLSFLDTSNGNAVAATAAINGGAATYGVAGNGTPLNEGDYPFNVVTADFNNDGILDLAVVDDDNATVDIFIGKGDGTFTGPGAFAINDVGVALAVGDFNGDGKLDLITVNQGKTGTISVLLGNGDGTFQPQVPYSVGNTPSAVSVGDFNNDGILDLAVTNLATPGTGSISILLGKGDGTFDAPVNYDDPNGPSFLATGDFNRDGITDLAASDLGGTVHVFLGNGDGTFQPAVSYAAGGLADYILSADLQKNGKLDLVVANYGDSTVSVLLGNGDGTFQTQVTYPTGNGPNDMVIGDFNNDGKLDLAISDDNDTTISILYGNGDGTFQAPLVDNIVGNSPWGIAAGDFNGDGLTDLAVTNSFDGTVSILLNYQLVTATASGVSLPGLGTHNVLASYPGDASHTASQSTTVALMGTPLIITSTALVVSPSTPSFGDSVTFTATVTPAPTGPAFGTVSFFSGKTLLGTASVNSSGVATFSSTSLLAGKDDLTAVYSGNSTLATSTSNDVTETVNTAFAVTAPATPFVMAQGGSVTLTVNVPPLGGAFNNVVTMSAAGLPPGATATFNPPQVTPGGSGATTMLTIQLLTGATNGLAPGRPLKIPFAPLGIAVALCGMALGFHHSTRKIAKRSLVLGGFLLVAASLVSCNGGFAGKPGTLPGNFVVTITGTSGNLHQSTTITLAVQ